MKKAVLFFLALFLTGCGPASINRSGNGFGNEPGRDAGMISSFSRKSYRPAKPANYKDPKSLTEYVNRLMSDGRNWRQHGVYIETLDDGAPVAMLNENGEFNPASVMKLSTTLAALDKLGLDYKFRTEFRADGRSNSQTGELNGNLMLLSGGDPSFSLSDATQAGESLRQLGINKVNGSLIVVGDFSCDENFSTNVSTAAFVKNSKIVFTEPPRYESFAKYRPRGRSLLTIESDSLLDIVHYLNAHSVNSFADMLATHMGGPQGVKNFLTDRIGMPRNSVYISNASGLEVNRMTPRDTVAMLRAMIQWLKIHKLKPAAVMAVAGIDAGTLRGRFTEGKFAGSVVAKTGTLYTTDSGVAALAGIMYTRDRGPLLFAIYDVAEGKRVPDLRKVQDEFLKNLINECGGPDPSENRGMRAYYDHPRSRFISANGSEPEPERYQITERHDKQPPKTPKTFR